MLSGLSTWLRVIAPGWAAVLAVVVFVLVSVLVLPGSLPGRRRPGVSRLKLNLYAGDAVKPGRGMCRGGPGGLCACALFLRPVLACGERLFSGNTLGWLSLEVLHPWQLPILAPQVGVGFDFL